MKMANTKGQNIVKLCVAYTECIYRIEVVLSTRQNHIL
jgi:hypothetical protein